MIFDLDGKPFVGRVQRRSLRNGPRFHDPAGLEPEVVVQARRVVLLNHEA